MQQKKLLYIEDLLKEPLDKDPYYTILKKAGYDLVVAKDGEEAWQRLNDEAHDCIIIDIMLPHEGKNIPSVVPRYRSGIYLLEMIQGGKFPKNEAVPVVVVSAIVDLEDIEKIKGYKVDYLEKPFKPPELLRAVEKYFKAG